MLFLPLCSGFCGSRCVRTSPKRRSEKFAEPLAPRHLGHLACTGVKTALEDVLERTEGAVEGATQTALGEGEGGDTPASS